MAKAEKGASYTTTTSLLEAGDTVLERVTRKGRGKCTEAKLQVALKVRLSSIKRGIPLIPNSTAVVKLKAFVA